MTCQLTYIRRGKFFGTWFQKPSDTGTILNYRSCAPLQHKKSIIQGTIHRLFRATSNWEAFQEALTKDEEIWERNQYPRHWVGNVVKDTINQLRMKDQGKGHRYNAGVAGTIHRLFRATSNWEAFQEALTKNEEIWERNQYPRHWVGNVVKDTINQLRMKDQGKGHRYNAGVAVKQQENTEMMKKSYD